MVNLFIFLAALFILSCGGGGGSSEGELIEGYFIDSPVENLRYKTSSGVEGLTDKTGKFFYRDGDIIKFYTGSILIGEAQGDYFISPLDLFKGYKDDIAPDDSMIKKLVSFFLYIDTDEKDFVLTVDENRLPVVDLKKSLTDCIFENDCPDEINKIISEKENSAGQHLNNTYTYITAKFISGCYEGSLIITNKTIDSFCNINNESIKILIDNKGDIKGLIGENKITGILKYKEISIDIPSSFGLSETLHGKLKRNSFSGDFESVGCAGKFSISKVDDNRCSDLNKQEDF